MFYQPPFIPEPTEAEFPAIIIHVLILFFLIILMLYCYKNIKDELPVITIYGFSLIIGLESLTHSHPPFSPNLEIFFLLFQSVIFLIKATEYYKTYKRKKRVN